jgi:beta-N-acetylhexosaminidase
LSGADPAPAAVVFGCVGLSLTADEKALFRACNPAGYILFARNIDTPDQVRRLTDNFRDLSGNDEILVLIDQEGGRVQRLRPPHWPDYPAMRPFGDRAVSGPNEAAHCLRLNYRLIAADLEALGINVDCAPVLDLPVTGSHEIIGDRAFSNDPALVAHLGRAVCDGLLQGGVLPVIKHIPGHGRAFADSHLELPRVDTPLDELRRTDFAPFVELCDAPAGMTAHIVYEAIDAGGPGSSSPAVVQDTIRGDIGFDGLLFSDDICMKALSGPLGARVMSVLDAGCDLALHCDGDFDDMAAIAETCPPMRPESLVRLNSAAERMDDSDDFDADDAKRRISAFLEG